MTILTDDSIQMSYFYHELEPGEYDEKQDQIITFIEQQSQEYEKALKDIIKKFHITYRSDYIGRAIRHFKVLLDESIRANTPLQISVYPTKHIAEYKTKMDLIYLSTSDTCPWKDFILYGSLIVSPDPPNSVVYISTSLPDQSDRSEILARFEVPKETIDFSLANSGIFKDFLISSFLEVSVPNNENLVVICKEYCF